MASCPAAPASTPPVSSPPKAGKHHVMARGLERRAIFRDDRDTQDFVQRLGALAEQEAWQVFAWALLPNHLHLLVRTGRRSLARTMGALLAGYAGAFNRRHRRAGHLFQNRYKSIVVERKKVPDTSGGLSC